MNKATCLVGAGLILGGMAGPVEARLVRYQINGKVYSYSTRNREQVARARYRIAAATAAYSARIRADAELASNPVAKVLGSRAQKDAAAARLVLSRSCRKSRPLRLRHLSRPLANVR